MSVGEKKGSTEEHGHNLTSTVRVRSKAITDFARKSAEEMLRKQRLLEAENTQLAAKTLSQHGNDARHSKKRQLIAFVCLQIQKRIDEKPELSIAQAIRLTKQDAILKAKDLGVHLNESTFERNASDWYRESRKSLEP